MIQKTTSDKAQVGIGTLIVFISLVLVAAIAAGVLLNTAGDLQEQGEQTAEQSTEEVSNKLVTDNVYAVGDGDGNVNEVRISVRKASGSDSIDVSRASLEYLNRDNGQQASLDFASTATAGSFTLSDETQGVSDNILEESGDRGDIVIQTNSNSSDSAPALLEENEEVRITIVTASGSESVVEFKMPNQISDTSAVVYDV